MERMENREWRMEEGGWRRENGEGRMEKGGWRMENGGGVMTFEEWVETVPERVKAEAC
jgi:hypothetical protein